MSVFFTKITTIASGIYQSMLHLAYPPVCASCRAEVVAQPSLCEECFNKIRHIERPYCDGCGTPFAYDLGEAALCIECIEQPPAFHKARAAFIYDAFSRRLVTRLKFYDQTQLHDFMVQQMLRAGRDLWQENPLLVPVPLHPSRLRKRRFNQSALLACGLAEKLSVDVLPDALQRVRKTKSQISLSRDERSDNVADAFRVHPRYTQMLRDRIILLVDDVFTTGATSQACIKALQTASVARVSVLTLTRVVKE